MEDDHPTTLSHLDSDLDLSFTTTTTTSARSSLASLSFTDSTRISTSSTQTPNLHPHPHSTSHQNWSAIRTATNLAPDHTLHLSHFKLIRNLGSGNLGRVFLCKLRDNDHARFALKVVDNNTLACNKKRLLQVQTEARILSALDHPFVPTLYGHIQASHYNCLIIDYCPNGDLHSLMRKQVGYRFGVDQARFYLAEVLVALEYLHSIGVVYRDLKPENILIRGDGHIMLSDFDLCFESDVVPKVDRRVKEVPKNRLGFLGKRVEEKTETEFFAEPTAAFSRSCVGTHEYLAPEVIAGDGHGSGVDWWAFGVLIYELLHGRTPFRGGSKESTLRNITSMKVNFSEMDGRGMGQVKDLIEKLLVKDPKKRLGFSRGATDIKQHPFFDGIKWPLIRMYRPPEVRGVTVKRSSKVHGCHAGGWSQKKRRSLWKGFKGILLKHKGVRC